MIFSLFALLGLLTTGPAFAAEVKEVADGVYAFIGDNGATNSGFVVTDAGVVVIDTQGPRKLAVELKEKIRDTAGDRPVIYAVNTHYHGDHTFGNQFFKSAVREIIAHDYTREALISKDKGHRTRFKKFFGEDSLMGFNFTPPGLTFSKKLTLRAGGRTIELIYAGPAHTGGDVYVFLPKEKVVFTGDLLYKGRLPWLGDGNVTGAVRACDELLSLDASVYVPGHGEVATREDLVAYRGYLENLIEEVRRLIGEGKTLAEVRKETKLPRYKGYLKYEEWLPHNAEKVFRELIGDE
jgi:cyclase